MALPVVYANTPYAGYVAWDAFNIQYLGTSYTIGAGNTSARWVWWRYNTGGASTVIEAGADVPDGVITNELLNPGFEESDPADAYLPRYWLRPVSGGRYYNVNHTTLLTAAEFFSGTQSVALTTGLAGATGPSIQKLATLTEGDTYRLTFRAKATAGYTGGLYCMLLNATGTTEVLRFATLNPTPTLTQTWQIYSGTILIPVGAASSRLMICSYNKAVGQVAYVDDVEFGENPIAGLTDDDLVLFGNKNGIPFRVQSTSFIDGDLLVDGSVGVQALAAKVIVANDVYSERAYLGTIRADAIESGYLSAILSIVDEAGALLVGSGISITQANGIVVTGPKGNTQIPTDGSAVQLAGDVYASSFNSTGAFKIGVGTNEVSTGAKLVVASGVTAPTAGPQITASWPWHTIHEGYSPRGLAAFPAEDAYSWLMTESLYGATITKLSKTTPGGNYDHGLATFDIRVARPEVTNSYGGLVVLGTEVYTLCQTNEMAANSDDYSWYIYQWHWTADSTPPQDRFLFVKRSPYQPSTNYGSFSGWEPTIGTDGTDLLIFQNNANSNWGVSRYTTSGSYVSTLGLYSDAGKTTRMNLLRDAGGITATAADLGGPVRWWITTQQDAQVYCFDTTGGRVLANEFTAPGGPMYSINWDGTRFSYRTNKRVYDFSKIADTDLATNKINAVQTWRLDNATGPAYATSETTASPPTTSISIPKRAWLMINSMTLIPDDVGDATDPDSLTFYLARGNTPANSAYKRIPPFTGIAKGSVSKMLDSLSEASGAAPPTTTTFGTATPGQIVSAAGGASPVIRLSGDGSGALGQAAWDAAGNWSWTTGQQTGAMRIAAAAQSIPNDVVAPYTTCTLGTVSYNSNCDTSVANTIKIVTAGFYVITASAMFDNGGAVAGSRRIVFVYVSGTMAGRSEVRAMDNSEYYTGNISIQMYLNVGDLVTMAMYQNGGTALSTVATFYPRLSVSKVSSQGSKGDTGAPGPPPAPPQIDSYTTVGSFTWTKPAGATRVQVVAVSGGAGGGSGRRGAALSIRAGGGGGAGGQVVTGTFTASDLGATENVTVGAGGAGGIAQATDDTNGLIGAVGVASYFGSAATNRWVGTNAPAAGAAGAVAAAAGGVAAAPGGSTGAASSATGAVGTTSNNQLGRGTSWSAGAGGGGGGCTAADVASAGGTGGPGISGSSTAPLGGTLGGGLGGAGAPARTGSYQAGDGGGGGGGSITTAAGKGGDGGFPGGGGGGGGASLNTFASGAGGKGGDGAVYVITYF